MPSVLWAAAVYNVAWGAAVVLFPKQLFRLAGMEAPNYPEFIQCLGMIVGVYGIAYAIAATNPIRHWAIVLTGLAGKILGPIGFLNAASRGRLPWHLGWTILTNDVIWWIPFTVMLAGAYRAYVCRQRALSPEVVRFALRTRTSHGNTLDRMSRQGPVLLVFLRHLGCTFCREALDDLARQKRAIEQTGTSIVLVHMAEEQTGAKCLSEFGLCGLAHISDPAQQLYRGFGLKRGTLSQLFGPRVVLRGLGLLPKYGVGRTLGDKFQMPGVFLLCHGEVVRSYRHKSVADRPAYFNFATGQDPLELGMQA